MLVIVNLDPHHMQHGWVEFPLDSLRPDNSGPDLRFIAHDLVDDVQYSWHGAWNYVRFDPGVRQGHILRLWPASQKPRT